MKQEIKKVLIDIFENAVLIAIGRAVMGGANTLMDKTAKTIEPKLKEVSEAVKYEALKREPYTQEWFDDLSNEKLEEETRWAIDVCNEFKEAEQKCLDEYVKRFGEYPDSNI